MANSGAPPASEQISIWKALELDLPHGVSRQGINEDDALWNLETGQVLLAVVRQLLFSDVVSWGG